MKKIYMTELWNIYAACNKTNCILLKHKTFFILIGTVLLPCKSQENLKAGSKFDQRTHEAYNKIKHSYFSIELPYKILLF